MTTIRCPYCRKPIPPEFEEDQCAHCGCAIGMLMNILISARESVQLALEALREGRVRDAHDFAYEAWGLRHTREAAAVGLLAATALGEPVEIARWLRRRRLTE